MTTLLSPSQKIKKQKPFAYDRFLEEQAEAVLIEETPELLAAIDEGLESLKREGSVPFEVVKAQLQKKWDTL
ncbi:MAG: hypothetical protein K2W99_01775 [Chthoniobacterales bacterium]|nr:hypothetical protein [Chthoniobacterales bacterium]